MAPTLIAQNQRTKIGLGDKVESSEKNDTDNIGKSHCNAADDAVKYPLEQGLLSIGKDVVEVDRRPKEQGVQRPGLFQNQIFHIAIHAVRNYEKTDRQKCSIAKQQEICPFVRLLERDFGIGSSKPDHCQSRQRQIHHCPDGFSYGHTTAASSAIFSVLFSAGRFS